MEQSKLTEEQVNETFDKLKKVKLAVLIPDSYLMEYKAFRRSFNNLWTNINNLSNRSCEYEKTRDNPKEFFKANIVECDLFRLDNRRNEMIDIALRGGATHLLFLDTDQTFPYDVFLRLWRNNKPIVAGLYFLKTPPYNPVLFHRSIDKYEKEGKYSIMEDYQKNSLITEAVSKADSKVHPIQMTGVGCLLIKREVFEKLKEPPYFKFKECYDKNGKWINTRFATEDTYFFERIIDETDYKIHIDTSCKCGHFASWTTIEETHFLGAKQMINEITKVKKQSYDKQRGSKKTDKKAN